MLKYLLRRIVLFIPTLIIISLLAFILSISAPGDPVSRMMTSAESADALNSISNVQLEQQKLWTRRLGLDLPVFYFSVTPASFPDTLYKIYDCDERKALRSLLYQFGNWKAIEAFHSSLQRLYFSHHLLAVDSAALRQFSGKEMSEAINLSRFTSISLLGTSEPEVVQAKLNELKAFSSDYPFLSSLQPLVLDAEKKFVALQGIPQRWKNFFPSFHFYLNNQYHRWLFGDGNWLTGKGSVYSKGLIRGDFGVSFITGLPVNVVILQRVGWSLLLTFISVVLAYLISLPIGIRAAVKHGSVFDRTSSVILFLLHSMPAFWVATLLLIVFANPGVLFWFPASGVKPVTGYPDHASFVERVRLSLPYLILPVIAYTYGSLAFLSRLTRVSMLEVIRQDYVQTARAKGLAERNVIYKHAFRNALLPIITVFANILPAAIGGSVILETIFTIPGMGLEAYKAMLSEDYPMIVGIFTLTGVLTLIGYLIADILYAVADPRISFSKK